MKIRMRLFASAREVVGKQEVIVDVPEGVTAADLLTQLVAQHPDLRRLAPSLKLAVNHEYVEGGRRLAEGDEVALIPPVSGGLDLFEVTESPLSLDVMVRTVGQNTSGALASFLGVVREFSRGRRVDHLEYDAYPEMAVAKMRQIGEESRSRRIRITDVPVQLQFQDRAGISLRERGQIGELTLGPLPFRDLPIEGIPGGGRLPQIRRHFSKGNSQLTYFVVGMDRNLHIVTAPPHGRHGGFQLLQGFGDGTGKGQAHHYRQ